MRRSYFRHIAAAFAVMLIPSVCMANAPAKVFVQVRETKLRSEPKYWASSVAGLAYGDGLSVLSEENGWQKVKTAAGAQGFVPLSAVTTRKVVLSSSAKAAATAGGDDDVLLAGKGFSADIEKQYAGQRKGLNYHAVDQMEKLRVSGGEIAAFLKNGKLKS
jgi:hypothetical protein